MDLGKYQDVWQEANKPQKYPSNHSYFCFGEKQAQKEAEQNEVDDIQE